MNITLDKVTDIFYLTDEFCNGFKTTLEAYMLGNPPKKKPVMSDSEVITIMILFHSGNFRNMKHFYLFYVKKHMSAEFPPHGFLQSVYRAYATCGTTNGHHVADMLFRAMHGHFLHRFHPNKGLQQ